MLVELITSLRYCVGGDGPTLTQVRTKNIQRKCYVLLPSSKVWKFGAVLQLSDTGRNFKFINNLTFQKNVHMA